MIDWQKIDKNFNSDALPDNFLGFNGDRVVEIDKKNARYLFDKYGLAVSTFYTCQCCDQWEHEKCDGNFFAITYWAEINLPKNED